MMSTDRLHQIAFVVRCAGAVTLSYVIASLVGLPFPMWASMSAAIIASEPRPMNRVIVGGRIVGTVAGVCTAGATSIVASGLNIGMVGQIAVAASICAIFAYSYPSTRVSLLTVPVVLLSAAPGVSIVIVALYRGSEVIIGSLVGGALHYAVDKAMARHFSKQRTPDIGD